MRKKYAREIDRRATELLRANNLFSVPVDVDALAECLGAKVVLDELEDDVSGFLLREQERSTIALNREHHPNRRRFTLAHECGHLFLHADRGDRLWVDKTLFFRDNNSRTGDDLAEIEANQFAAGTLMPEELIKKHLENIPVISEFDVSRLALRFQVSERAMMVRLISLGLVSSVAA